MKKLLLAIACTSVACTSAPINRGTSSQEIFMATHPDFSGPESSYPYGDFLYVSNMDGAGTVKDGHGWISKLDKRGNVLVPKWVEGFHAPKGMRASGNTLYVADIDAVTAIDIRSGAKTATVAIPGASLLNDIELDGQGGLFVSDTLASKIFRLSSDLTVSVYKENLEEAPNGLYKDGNELFVANYFSNVGEDPNTHNKKPWGRLMAINLSTGTIRYLSERLGSLDGLEKKGSAWIVTAKRQNKTMIIDGTSVTTILEGDPASLDVADIGYEPDRKVLYIPSTAGNWVKALRLE